MNHVEEESVDNLALPTVQGFPFAHLGENTPRTQMLHLQEGLNRNGRFSSDMFGGLAANTFTQVRSRAGSNFDIHDCFSKDNNAEDHFFGSIAVKNTYSTSLFKRPA